MEPKDIVLFAATAVVAFHVLALAEQPTKPEFNRCSLLDCNVTDPNCDESGRCKDDFRTCCDRTCAPKRASCAEDLRPPAISNYSSYLAGLNRSQYSNLFQQVQEKIEDWVQSTPCWPKDRCSNGSCLPGLQHCDNGQCVEFVSDCAMFWTKVNYQISRRNVTCYPPELCFRNVCVLNYWMCDNGECINEGAVCRGGADCSDGSDEKYCKGRCFPPPRCTNNTCDYGYYQCSDGQCILQEQICDTISDCADNSDERNCSRPCWPEAACNQYGSCKPGYFECDGGKCIEESRACDMRHDCNDQTDETRMGHGFKCVLGRNFDTCVLPQQQVFDSTARCQDHADNCTVPGFCFECLDKRLTISDKQRCDGVVDCFDASDECFCSDKKRAEQICDSICLHSDSPSAPRPVNAEVFCPCLPGQFHCGNRTCLNTSQICDGIMDCPISGDDEKFCLRSEWQNMETVWCPGDVNNNSLAEAVLCDGRPECYDMSDECDGRCDVMAPFCKLRARFNSLAGPYEFLCDNKAHFLDVKSMCDGKWSECSPRIKDEEEGCPSRFYCPSGDSISIDINLICDGIPQCDDMTDEINCTGRFYCENSVPYSVPLSKKLDGYPDCSDSSDECPREMDNNALSSRKELLGALGFRVTTWIIGSLALIGNLINLANVTKSLIVEKKMNNLSRVNYFLLLNLSIADTLMGVYLIVLSAKSLSFSGQFCRHDKAWRTSSPCSSLGSLALVSSEMSVLILCLLTTLRLVSIANPIKTKRSSVKLPVVLVSVAWFVSILLGVLPQSPALADYFVSDIWMPTNFTDFETLDKSSMVTLVRRLAAISPSALPPSGTSWYKMADFLAQNYDIRVKGYFGYFSDNSVCLPRFFVTAGDAGWGYSAGIVIFNFLAFCYVCGAYWAISHMTSNKPVSQRRAKQLRKMHGRITRIVLTDFACWVPICLMSFLQLGGVPIPGQAYAFSAVVLLPINSAVNPFLYSDVKFASFCCFLKSFVHRQNRVDDLAIRSSAKLAVISRRRADEKRASIPTKEQSM